MKRLFIAGAVSLVAASAAAQVSGSVSIWGRNGSLSINVPTPVYVAPPVYVQPPVYVAPPVYVQPPVYVAPQPSLRQPWPNNRHCLQHPYYDQYGRLIGYEFSCH